MCLRSVVVMILDIGRGVVLCLHSAVVMILNIGRGCVVFTFCCCHDTQYWEGLCCVYVLLLS